ncbi:hypothetical protein J6590_029042 [Homalodisca vitripennis]|nr:hypothetical protein J6590_029042 [Homalodisca vitripennis]
MRCSVSAVMCINLVSVYRRARAAVLCTESDSWVRCVSPIRTLHAGMALAVESLLVGASTELPFSSGFPSHPSPGLGSSTLVVLSSLPTTLHFALRRWAAATTESFLQVENESVQ